MSRYVGRRQVRAYPRLPLKGSLDLTYRCGNDCRHCRLRLPARSPASEREPSFDEIRRIVDEARSLGCREWTISDGEPMLRADFSEIFDYVTARSARYTLITGQSIARSEFEAGGFCVLDLSLPAAGPRGGAVLKKDDGSL